MPETVWDYVAKLKTSVTKASNRYSICFLCLLRYYWKSISNLSCVVFCLLGIMCDPASSCNRGRRGGLRFPIFLFQQQRSFWCSRQCQSEYQGFISCPTQCAGINPFHTTPSWRTRSDNALTTTYSPYIMNVCIFFFGLGKNLY